MEEQKKCHNSSSCSGDCSNCKHSSCSGDCSSCSSKCGGKSKEDFLVQINDKSNIKLVIGVLSGKGGVGKSLVTSLLAAKLSKAGLKVGVLDGDITGPSIPKAFNVHEHAYQEGGLILPAETKGGIKVISSNMLLDNEDDPIIWRSSLICSLLTQFYKDVKWGKLDVLLIDMPPGTGDISLTTFQSFPIDGVVMVTAPQDLVSMIVKKSITMVELMNIPVLGVVENMSYVVCPNCDEKIYIYGNKDSQQFKERYGYDRLDQVPFDGNLTAHVDSGNIESFDGPYLDNLVDMIRDMGDMKYE
jgi:Mrp family chromosome partitioning ATPase